MDTPQEVEVWYVLPALRKQFTLELKRQGIKQKEIAKHLNITEAAVSQYLRNKRGEEINFPKKIIQEIALSAKRLIKEDTKFRYEFQRIINLVNKEKFICVVCRGHTGIGDKCEICYKR